MLDSIIFDFDSTLVDYHYSDTQALNRVVDMLPIKIDNDQFRNKSGEIICQLYDQGLRLGSKVHKERLKITLDFFEIDWCESYLKEYLEVYINETKPYEFVFEFLDSLNGKIKIGLLTNSMDSFEQRARIKKSELSHYFDVVCIASEIGSYKPNREAFEITLRKLNASADNSVFIGDSEEYDIKGSKSAEMIAIKKDNKIVRPTIADYRFSDYRELNEILKILENNLKRNRPTTGST